MPRKRPAREFEVFRSREKRRRSSLRERVCLQTEIAAARLMHLSARETDVCRRWENKEKSGSPEGSIMPPSSSNIANRGNSRNNARVVLSPVFDKICQDHPRAPGRSR